MSALESRMWNMETREAGDKKKSEWIVVKAPKATPREEGQRRGAKLLRRDGRWPNFLRNSNSPRTCLWRMCSSWLHVCAIGVAYTYRFASRTSKTWLVGGGWGLLGDLWQQRFFVLFFFSLSFVFCLFFLLAFQLTLSDWIHVFALSFKVFVLRKIINV